MRVKLCAMVSLFLLGASCLTNAQADERCPWLEQPWACYGQIELRKAGAEEIVRMIRFSNGEFMAEIERQDGKKRFLGLRSGFALAFGLTATESLEPNRSPFLFFDYGFALPVGALRDAFPGGPDSVPEGSTKKEVSLEKVDKNFKAQVLLSTSRVGQGPISYQLTVNDRANATTESFSGVLDPVSPAPFPDDYPLVGWKHPGSATLATLGEARAMKDPMVGGDIRR